MYFYPEHKYLVDLLTEERENKIKDTEHWRNYSIKQSSRGKYSYIAECSEDVSVVVLEDGACYIGVARQNPCDNYDHKIGYGLSLKRALQEAVRDQDFKNRRMKTGGDFRVPTELKQRALRDTVKQAAQKLMGVV